MSASDNGSEIPMSSERSDSPQSRWHKQTVSGGVDLPPEQRGDCLGAVIASLLRLPVDAIANTHGGGWWSNVQSEVGRFGYSLVYVERGIWPEGYWIAVVPSLNHEGSTHVIVCRGSRFVHDPSNLKTYDQGTFKVDDVIAAWVLVPLDPGECPLGAAR